MNFLRAAVATLFALAFAIPSHAAPEVAVRGGITKMPATLFSTGMHANEVEPIVKGVALESAHVAVYTACFLALASEDTCVDIASKARAVLAR